MQQPEPAAADAGTVRLHHCQHRCYGDRGIKRIATLCQYIETGIRRQRMRAGDGRWP
jgi:hypothetical protein